MKQLLFFFLLFTSTICFAQPKIITQAIVTTKTTIIVPEGEENAAPQTMQSNNGEEVRVMRLGGEGETKSVTYLKNELTKTIINNDMGRTTVIRDNANKKTTTLLEVMGRKTGFYVTDEEQEQMRKQMDSLMQTRRQNEAGGQIISSGSPVNSDIIYTEETKKIAGFVCKKALVVNTTAKDVKDTTAVWYNPDIKLQNIITTGGMNGFGNLGRSGGINTALEKINGFVMEYETKINKGRTMKVEVTKLEVEKQVVDKEFEVPKDFDVKPMKDMQNGGRGGFQMRVGG